MSSDDDESARAERLLAEEAEEEAALQLAMQLLNTHSSPADQTSKPFKPTPSPPPAQAASAASTDGADAAGDSSPPPPAAIPALPSPSPSPGGASGESGPKPRIDKKKKSFSAGGMDINALDALLAQSSDTDEEERERRAERKARAQAQKEAKKAAEASAAAAAAAEKKKQMMQTQAPQRSPSSSPSRGTSTLRLSRTASLPVKRTHGSRPVGSGVSPSMHPQPARHSASTRPDESHRPHASPSHTDAQSRISHAPRATSRSPRHSLANAALESRIRELEQHYQEQQSYSHPHASPVHPDRPASSPGHVAASMDLTRGAQNQLKLRILELERDALAMSHEVQNLQRKVKQQEEQLAEKDKEALLAAEASRERENRVRTELSAQVSQLEQAKYTLEHELTSLRASGIAKDTSYRELVSLGGKLPPSVLTEPKELAKIQQELRDADRLIEEMNRDNAKLHSELKIVEAKLRHQIAQNVEEQKQIRFEVQNKTAEVDRLQSAQNSMLDPGARERIAELTTALEQQKEKHHHEVASLKYELDKLRMVKVELSMRKEDATNQGREQLRLALESLQEKYNALKVAKETETRELHTKLVWYIENQSLITDLEAQLRASKKEVERLQDENLLMNHLLPPGSKNEATGKEIKLKPRPVDVKRIKELEAKVAELTEVIKKKSSVTLSAVPGVAAGQTPAPLVGMIAAIKPSMEENEIIRALRTKVAELESSLHARDEESVSALRSLRQESDQLKLLWERRLAKLSKELEDTKKKLPLTGRNKLNRISELERALEETRAFYTEKTRKLHAIIRRMRGGERVDEKEVKEADEEAAEQAEKEQQEQQAQPAQKQEESKEAAPPPNAHDSIPLPHSRHNQSMEGDIPRSPLRAHAQPHPHPHPSPVLSTAHPTHTSSDVLLLRQSLLEAHSRELHTLASKYESQVESMKAQWESQVQMLRATHDADARLHASLLQQARDECVHVRTTLTQEMAQRSLLQERCLQLESELQQAKNMGGYLDYQQLQHSLELHKMKFEQKIREFEEAAAVSRDDIRVERMGWEEQVRQKNQQLTQAKQQFQQLTAALRQMQQQQAQQQQQWKQWQQQQIQQQQQQQLAQSASLSSPSQRSSPLDAPAGPSILSTLPPSASFSPSDEDDIAHLISPSRGSATTRPHPLPPPPVDEQAMQLQWSYINGGNTDGPRHAATQQQQSPHAQPSPPARSHAPAPQRLPQQMQSPPPQRAARPQLQSPPSRTPSARRASPQQEPAVRQPAAAVAYSQRTRT